MRLYLVEKGGKASPTVADRSKPIRRLQGLDLIRVAMKFESEEQLKKFASESEFIKSRIASADYYEYELTGLFGIPDLVIADVRSDGSLSSFAIELKLSDWRRALRQAFRYRAFAWKSFVLMDSEYVHRARRHEERFRDANVGLLSIRRKDCRISKHVTPNYQEPYSQPLSERFRNIVWRHLRRSHLQSKDTTSRARDATDILWESVPFVKWELQKWVSRSNTILSA